MPLSAGDKLGPYEILAPIGAGGMGEVFRARDPRLNREVAIKVSQDRFSHRFEREARAVAALNHPNICTLHDVGSNYLVMEFIEGESPKGPLPLDETLRIARQIAGALEAAHEKGIVHRDLKPANIKIKPDGTVKVLDFGLAKATGGGDAANPEDSPTISMAATRAGSILGTAAYMSPEQARGKVVDKRADIWAFGVVLYEMLTGKRLFQGEDLAQTLASVVKEEPRLDEVPVTVRRLLRKCLEKDPKRRLRDIGDAWELLEEAPPAGTPAPRNAWLWVVALGAGLIAVAAGAGWWRAAQPMDRPLMRFTDDLGAEISLASYTGPAVAISPDGQRLAYISADSAGNTHLSVRLMGSSKSTVLAGTEGASAPFFSPEGRRIAFFADQKLKKISMEGGAAVTLCNVPNPRGGAWGENDNILFPASARSTLLQVPSSGGTPQPATELNKQKSEATHRFPQFLPGGEAFLFTSSRDNNNFTAATIEAQSIKTGMRKTLVEGSFGRYLSGGYLIYLRGTTVFAAPMDVKRLELTGPAWPVLEDVSGNTGGLAQIDVTPSGTVVYVAGSTQAEQSFFWLDVSGKPERLKVESGPYSIPRVSPDGTRIAVLVSQGSAPNLGVYEWAANRMTSVTFLKKGGVSTFPAWTPDSRHLVFPIDSQELSGPGIYWMRADGAGEPQRLLESQNLATYSISPDGKRLAYFRRVPDYEIGTIPLDLSDPEHPKAGKPEPFAASKFDLRVPAFSPDGRWMAYVSAESGPSELYVRPFPGTPSGSSKWQVSNGDVGGMPFWSRTANELFYEAGNGRIWVIGYAVSGDSFAADKPRLWSEKAPAIQINAIAPMPGGKRFVMVMPTSAAEKQTHVTFLLNFSDELRRRTREAR